jgi:phytoene dehydrogenase-like protein
MGDRHVVIVGGGLSGLAAGCYLRASGFRTTVVEHNLALGGVCTAWSRGPYTIDGCVQWLSGGPFGRVYEELGIQPATALRPLSHLLTYRVPSEGVDIAVTRDLDALVGTLARVSAADVPALRRMVEAARVLAQSTTRSIGAPMTVGATLRGAWEAEGASGPLGAYRASVSEWSNATFTHPLLRRFFTRLTPPTSPALTLLFLLGYLERGWIASPVGGTAALRDALVHRYEALGGHVRLHATVDEVLVEDGRAVGIRLADGDLLRGDAVISTASLPETTRRLLGGQGGELVPHIADGNMFQPIVLASFGVAASFASSPSRLVVDGITPFRVGDCENDHLRIRVCNDDPSFAPAGQTVVQATLDASYEWWATRGTRYTSAKDAVAATVIAQLSPHFPGLRDAVRVNDIATPLTFWTMARSWRGAHEGVAPTEAAMFGTVERTVPGVSDFYMAGQWVERGGGVPTALASGRAVAALACAAVGRPLVSPG